MNGYVLVGGRSRRMGRSKVELFLERVVAAAQPVFDDVIAVQTADGDDLSIPTIHEAPHDGAGPIFGVECALEHARRRCAVIAVDYPLVTSGLLTYLVDAATAEAGITLPVWRDVPQPLCAIYDPSVLPLIRKRVAQGRRDVVGLLDVVRAKMIPENDLRARFTGEPLLNVNTPAELEEAEALYGK